MIDFSRKKVISTFFAKGSVHDFNMFKQSFKETKFDASTQILADSGYQGVGRYHACCKLPLKETKLRPLTEEPKTG